MRLGRETSRPTEIHGPVIGAAVFPGDGRIYRDQEVIMRSTTILACTAALSLLTACEGIIAEGEGEGEEGEGEGEGDAGEGEGEGDAGEGEGEGEGDTGEGEGEGEGDTGEFECDSGIVFGHPAHDSEPTDRAEDGDPLSGIVGQPFLAREIAFVGERLVTHIGEEVWFSDLSEATPTIHKLAGFEDTQNLLDGPCDDARFANLQSIVAGSDGSLYLSDQTANAILQITDPFGDCQVHYYAGTSTDTVDISPVDPPNVGDRNGPGLQAQFGLPVRLAIDDDDTLYVWDEGNEAIKKILHDTDHTVSEFFDFGDARIEGMNVLDGKLYVLSQDGSDITLQSIDLASGVADELFSGRPNVVSSDLFSSSESSTPIGGLATDGTDLFFFFKGFIFSADPATGDTTYLGGQFDFFDRTLTEFEDSCDEADAVVGACYDYTVEQPIDVLQIAGGVSNTATAGAFAWLNIDSRDDLWFTTTNPHPYIMRLTCGR
jgi:hypothetical protein